jgi:hypothetical protein
MGWFGVKANDSNLLTAENEHAAREWDLLTFGI